MSSLGGTSPGVSPRPFPSGSDALFVPSFTEVVASLTLLWFACIFSAARNTSLWISVIFGPVGRFFLMFFLYTLFMPYYYIFSFTVTEFVRHPQTSYMQEVRWGGRCGRGNQLATQDRWSVQFPGLTPSECVSLRLTLPHSLGDAQSTFFLLWAWHLPEKLQAQNKSVPSGGSGLLGASCLHQPRAEGWKQALGNLLLTLTHPESKWFPTRKAKESLTFVCSIKGGRERGGQCPTVSLSQAQPQVPLKSWPSPTPRSLGTQQSPLLTPTGSVLPLALTLSNTWPRIQFLWPNQVLWTHCSHWSLWLRPSAPPTWHPVPAARRPASSEPWKSPPLISHPSGT